MEELSDSKSTLPWCWVIEALAKSPLVNTSILHGLVSKAPPLVGISGKEAREAIALRCLERLYSSPNTFTENVEVSDLSEIRFDLSESCEAALERITSGSKGSSSEDLNSDIELFIKHKKESLSKSTLEMLNDTIIEGIHPLSTSLKEIIERDFPENQDQCVLNGPFNGGDPTSPPSKSGEEDHADKIMLEKENECSLRSDNHVQEIDSVSNDNQCPPAKKLKIDNVSGNEMVNGTEGEKLNQVNKTIGIRDGKSNGNDGDDDQAKTYVESHDQQHILRNNGDHSCEEADLAYKSTNLSNHIGVTKGSLAMIESQSGMCMKCNKDGQLLTCTGSSCALLFHENCLGCSISFDDQGNFYCPFCAYSRAISEYVKAKEKVSLARKNLSLFIGGRSVDQLEQDGNTSSGNDVGEDLLKHVDQTNAVKNVNEDHQSSLKGKSLELSRSSAYLDSNGLVLAAQHTQGGEIIIHLSQGPARNWSHGDDYRGCDGAQFGNNEKIKSGSVIYAELKRKNKSTRCKITEIREDASSESISESNSDLEGLVQDKRNDGTSSVQCPKPLREIPKCSRWRRKKVPWTAEEEAMLKKGVETFVRVEGQVIPWKAILEYGGWVFQSGRTPIDLKDKWRNIMGRGTSPKVK